MTTKKFDCIAMKQEGAKNVLDRLQGLSLEQQLEYWRKASEKLQAQTNAAVPNQKLEPV